MLKPITVTELTRRIKEQLEPAFPEVLVTGEISNLAANAASSHVYFTLKDADSQIRCTLWKRQRQYLKFAPLDGMAVVVLGNVRVYEKGGNYQLNVIAVEPAGKGALQVAFEQLKQKLADEGLFEQGRKRPLPKFPDRIGIVTSGTGAALCDIVKILRRRMPSVGIVVNPVQVQGDGAAGDIARGIREFNEYGNVDVLIVGRGGGSIEDLWAFNEESVARAIAASSIPVISAVGHEVDYTIADFVADMRASTPSNAAGIAVQNRDDLVLRIKSRVDRIVAGLHACASAYRLRIDHAAKSPMVQRPLELVQQHSQKIDDLAKILGLQFRGLFDTARARFSHAVEKLEILNPTGVLTRGYSITRADGRILSDAAMVAIGGRIETQLKTGRLVSRVELKS